MDFRKFLLQFFLITYLILITLSEMDAVTSPAEWQVLNYTGKLGYNETCMSDSVKEGLLQGINGNASELLLANLSANSCDIQQFLECVQVEMQVKPINDHDDINVHPVPLFKCRCPEYDMINTENVNAYFDVVNGTNGSCVMKVRAKCFGFNPLSARRYNGSASNKVIDGRPLPLEMPCVKNAYCNKVFSTYDVNSNKCVCEKGFFPGDDNDCDNVLSNKRTLGQISGLLLIIFPFAVFFVIMVCGEMWEKDKNPGSQEEVVVPSSGFHKKIIVNYK